MLLGTQGYIKSLTPSDPPIIGSHVPTEEKMIQVAFRLMNLNANAATITAWLEIVADSVIRERYVLAAAKAVNTDTTFGMSFPPQYVAAGETIRIKVRSSNANDTSAITATRFIDVSPAAAAEASSFSGDGDVPVDHNTGGTDSLRYTLGGDGADNVVIKAYLQSEYDAGTRTLRGTAYTGPDGRWLAPLMLNAGAIYTLVASLPGVTEATTTNLTVPS